MDLTEPQIQQVVDWINGKLPGGWKCNFCGEKKGWKIDPKIFRRQEYDGDVINFGGTKAITLIVISCSNCGSQITMDPRIIGIEV